LILGVLPFDALTTPALLSPRERREKARTLEARSPLSLGERGLGSEGFEGQALPDIQGAVDRPPLDIPAIP
jgi:hypothetical protein